MKSLYFVICTDQVVFFRIFVMFQQKNTALTVTGFYLYQLDKDYAIVFNILLRLLLIFMTSTSICFFSLKHFGHFLLRHFGHWNISVICFTFVSKLTITVFFSLYFQTFWPKWLNVFSFWSMTKKTSSMVAPATKLLSNIQFEGDHQKKAS